MRFRKIAIGSLIATLILHIAYDAVTSSYEGGATSLMLGGLVGTALGLNEWYRGKGGGPS